MQVFWKAIRRNVFKHTGAAETRHADTVKSIRHAIFGWYRSLDKKELSSITQIQDLSIKMLGTQGRPKLKLKAAETKHLIPFTIELIRKHRNEFGIGEADLLMEAGTCLLRIDKLMDQQPRKLQRHVSKDCLHIGR